MCKIIAIANQKGGQSKSTTAVNLAVGLARNGKRVAVVDADPQGSCTASLGYKEPDELEITLATILGHIIDEEEFDPRAGILHHEEGVDLIPANIELSGLEVAMINIISREHLMQEYSDLTMLQAQVGLDAEILEMSDLDKYLQSVTDEEVEEKIKQISDFFEISGDSPSDPIAKKPTEEQMQWSAKVACAQEKMVRDRNLDSVSYYYHGREDHFEEVQSGFIVGFSLLNAQGIACAGEGDIKTALAMKIADICGKGGSFCEIVAADFNRDTMILGHDGPFHFTISKGKPILRGMGVYHGKRGSGVSVEAKVCPGAVTTLGVTQTGDGRLKFNISEGEAIDAPILLNGNTSTHIRFAEKPAEYMDKWFVEVPTHHFALSVGHNAGLFKKIAELLDIPYAIF